MVARRIEFVELRGDPTLDDHGMTLAGRCMKGPLRVGDTFTSLVPSDGPARDVQLVVEEIHFYGQWVDEVDAPYAAELRIVGVGTELVAPSDTLEGDSLDRDS